MKVDFILHPSTGTATSVCCALQLLLPKCSATSGPLLATPPIAPRCMQTLCSLDTLSSSVCSYLSLIHRLTIHKRWPEVYEPQIPTQAVCSQLPASSHVRVSVKMLWRPKHLNYSGTTFWHLQCKGEGICPDCLTTLCVQNAHGCMRLLLLSGVTSKQFDISAWQPLS